MDGFARDIGIDNVTAHDGTSTARLRATERHLNPAGTVHGGVLATLVDTAMGAAVRSQSKDDEVPATSQLTVAYLRPGAVGELQASARVRKQGAHLLVCEAEVEQASEALLHAVATFALVEP